MPRERLRQAVGHGKGTRRAAEGSGRLRWFWAVGVSNTSSLTPLKPRSRRRSSLMMRVICANRISWAESQMLCTRFSTPLCHFLSGRFRSLRRRQRRCCGARCASGPH